MNIDMTKKQFEKLLDKKLESFATKKDFYDVLKAVNLGFDAMEEHFARVVSRLDNMDERLDRMASIIDSWPPPSYIHDLLERISVVEKELKIKPSSPAH